MEESTENITEQNKRITEQNRRKGDIVISISGVKKFYNSELVLDDISFDVERGEKLILFGHNGSGKTTLIRCIMGFEMFSGEISVFGKNVLSEEFVLLKRKIGYVPQIVPLWRVGVKELIDFVRSTKKLKDMEIENLCDFFSLDVKQILHKKLTELSGGMKQKLFLAFALSGNPDLLILDEPFSNLDISSQERLFEFLSSFKSTQVISTHRIEDVSFATRVIFMRRGKIQFDGTPSSFVENFKVLRERDWKKGIDGKGLNEEGGGGKETQRKKEAEADM